MTQPIDYSPEDIPPGEDHDEPYVSDMFVGLVVGLVVSAAIVGVLLLIMGSLP